MRLRSAFLIAIITAACMIYAVPAFAQELERVIFVDADNLSPGDGTDWDSAFNDLQAALAAASDMEPTEEDPVQIWVAEGIYKPSTDDREVSFQLLDDVALYGGFDGTETLLEERSPVDHPTILSGDIDDNDTLDGSPVDIIPDAAAEGLAGNETNSLHVVDGTLTGPTAIIDGFVITAGSANNGGLPGSYGGGILIYGGSPTVRSNHIIGNYAFAGGGIHADDFGAGEDRVIDPTFIDNRIEGNFATSGGGIWASIEPAADRTTPHFERNIFIHNTASRFGGAGYIRGDPIYYFNQFIENTAPYGGALHYGSLYGYHNGDVFYGNSALIYYDDFYEENRGGLGGAVYGNFGLYATFVNTIFSGNYAEVTGGALHYLGGPYIINTTITGNEAGSSAGGVYSTQYGNTTVYIYNSLITGNTAPSQPDFLNGNTFNEPVIGLSFIGGGPPNNSISTLVTDTDPAFLRVPSNGDGDWLTPEDNDYGDLRLQPGSPAIDSGTNSADVSNRADYQALPDNDASEGPRFLDDPSVPDSIFYFDEDQVDIGAYEFDPDYAPGFTLGFGEGLTLDEASPGTRDSFTVVLDDPPIAPVTISLDGQGQCTASPVTFTPSDWDTPQSITLNVVDDAIDEGGAHTCAFTLTAQSTDGYYDSASAGFIGFGALQSATISDNDTAGFDLSTAALALAEGGSAGSFTLALTSQPTAPVTVALTGAGLSFDSAELTFTASNWDTPQSISVSVVDDQEDQGDRAVPIAFAVTTDADEYAPLTPEVTVNVDEDDTAGFTVDGDPTAIEAGEGDTFTVALTSQPSEGELVAVDLSVSDGQSDLDRSTITFSATNWDQPQTVQVTAVDDTDEEGTHSSTVVLSATSSQSGSPYAGLTGTVEVTIIDDDRPDNLLTNGSFESVLSASSDWGPMTGSAPILFPLGNAPEGELVLLFSGAPRLSAVEQIVAHNGEAGDVVRLTFYIGGRNTLAEGKIGGQLTLLDASGSELATDLCLQVPRLNSFNATQVVCQIVAESPYTQIRVRLGAINITNGYFGFDDALLSVN